MTACLLALEPVALADWTQFEIAYTIRTLSGKQNVENWRRTRPLTVSSFETATQPALRSEIGTATLMRAKASWKLELKGRGYDNVAVWDGRRLFVKAQGHVLVLPTCDPTYLEVLPRIGLNLPGLQIYKPAEVPNAAYVLEHRSRRSDRKLHYNFTSLIPASKGLKVQPAANFLGANFERRVSPTRFETLLDTESNLRYETYHVVSKKNVKSEAESSILPHLSEGTVLQFPGPISFSSDPKGGSLDAQCARAKAAKAESWVLARIFFEKAMLGRIDILETRDQGPLCMPRQHMP